MTTKVNKVELVATLTDDVSAKAAQIDQRLKETAANASKLGGIAGNPMLGRLGQLGQLGAGGGGSAFALGGAALGGFAFERLTASALEMQRAVAAGEATMRDLAAEAVRTVPVLGQFVKGFDNLRGIANAMFDETTKRQVELAQRTADALEESFKRSTVAVDAFQKEASRLLGEASILGLPEDARGDARTRANFAGQSAAISEKLQQQLAAEQAAMVEELRKVLDQRDLARSALEREALRTPLADTATEVELRRELLQLDSTEIRIRRAYQKSIEQLTSAANEQQTALHALEAATLNEAERIANEKAAEALAKAQEAAAREAERLAESIARGRERFADQLGRIADARQAVEDFQRDAAERMASDAARAMAGFEGERMQAGFGNFALRGDIAAVQQQGMRMQAELEGRQIAKRQEELQKQLVREVSEISRVLLRGMAI